MADANVVALQTQINRFADAQGIDAIAVDGIIGQETLGGALMALDYVRTNEISPELSQAASGLWDQINTVGDLQTFTVDVTGALSAAADILGYVAAQPPARPQSKSVTTRTQSAANRLLQTQQSKIGTRVGAAGSLANLWSVIPMWGKIGGGLVLVGSIWWFLRHRHAE